MGFVFAHPISFLRTVCSPSPSLDATQIQGHYKQALLPLLPATVPYVLSFLACEKAPDACYDRGSEPLFFLILPLTLGRG